MIAPFQIKMIHVFKSLLNRDDKTYRGALKELYGVASSKELTYAQAAQFIGQLQEAAERFGLWSPGSYAEKHKTLGQRVNMATPAQLRMVEEIWAELYPEPDERKREAALNAYLFRFFRVSHPRFLDDQVISKVLHALKEMQARKDRTARKPVERTVGPETEGKRGGSR
jgi:hypothetical protein